MKRMVKQFHDQTNDKWWKNTNYYVLFQDEQLLVILGGVRKSLLKIFILIEVFLLFLFPIILGIPLLIYFLNGQQAKFFDYIFTFILILINELSISLFGLIQHINKWKTIKAVIRGDQIPVKINLWLITNQQAATLVRGIMMTLNATRIFYVLTTQPKKITPKLIGFQPFYKEQKTLSLVANETIELSIGGKKISFVIQCTDPYTAKPPQFPEILYVVVKNHSLLKQASVE